jgi:hypothetical protein
VEPQFLPFIGIELKVLKLPFQEGVATIDSAIVAQPDDMLIVSVDEPDKDDQSGSVPRDRTWWETKVSEQCIATVDEITKFCNQEVGPSRIDYSAQSYISLKKGRRCWLPMWPRAAGVYVYIPGGHNGSQDSPSDFYHEVQTKLETIGLESPTWTYKYNAGANPIGFSIPQEKASHSIIREILKACYDQA